MEKDNIYLEEAPEHGKGTFFKRLEDEIHKEQYPDALYLGIADSAKNNWSFLEHRPSITRPCNRIFRGISWNLSD